MELGLSGPYIANKVQLQISHELQKTDVDLLLLTRIKP